MSITNIIMTQIAGNIIYIYSTILISTYISYKCAMSHCKLYYSMNVQMDNQYIRLLIEFIFVIFLQNSIYNFGNGISHSFMIHTS